MHILTLCDLPAPTLTPQLQALVMSLPSTRLTAIQPDRLPLDSQRVTIEQYPAPNRLAATRAAYTQIRAAPPNLIYAVGFSPYGLLAATLGRHFGIPSLVMLPTVPDSAGVVWQTWMNRQADWVAVPDMASGQRLLDLTALPAEHLMLIPPALALPAPLDLTQPQPRAWHLFCRAVDAATLDLCLDVAWHVVAKLPAFRAIVGAAPALDVSAQVARLGLQDHILVIQDEGQLDRRLLDVQFALTTDGTATPYDLIQIMASGPIPIHIGMVPPPILESDGNGILATDAKDAARALLTLSADEPALASLRQAGQASVEPFRVQQVADIWTEILTHPRFLA